MKAFLERHPAAALLGIFPPLWLAGLPLARKEGWVYLDVLPTFEIFFAPTWPLVAFSDLKREKDARKVQARWRRKIAVPANSRPE